MNINKLIRRTVKMQDDTERKMRDAAGMLSAMIGAEVLAIRHYGVHMADAAWVAEHPGAYSIRRSDSLYPYEVVCEIDGVTYFSLTNQVCYQGLLKEAME